MREDLITAYLDGELEEAEQLRVEQSLDQDPSLRRLHDELLQTRRGLQRHFSGERTPQAPAVAATSRGRWRVAAFAGAAAVMIASAAVFWMGTQRAEASAEVVMQRAVSSYAEAEEVELWLRWELPGGDLVENVLGNSRGGMQAWGSARGLKLRVAQGNRFVAMPTSDPSRDFEAQPGLMGFDGECWWRCDREDGKLVVIRHNVDPDQLNGRRFSNLDLVRLLSWDFVRNLDPERVDIDEVTWPADQRGGRRVFEVRPRAFEDDKESADRCLQVRRARVTVDPREDRIERVEADVSVFRLAKLRVTIDLKEVSAASDAGLFRDGRHVEANVPRRIESGK